MCCFVTLLFVVFRLLCLVCNELTVVLPCWFILLVYVFAGLKVSWVAFCLSFEVCCLVFVVCCLLFAACCLLVFKKCCVLVGCRCVLSVVCCLLFVVFNVLFAVCVFFLCWLPFVVFGLSVLCVCLLFAVC